jgi:hypothetical protein
MGVFKEKCMMVKLLKLVKKHSRDYCEAYFLTLSYSSKINGYLYHQRVSPPLKKLP